MISRRVIPETIQCLFGVVGGVILVGGCDVVGGKSTSFWWSAPPQFGDNNRIQRIQNWPIKRRQRTGLVFVIDHNTCDWCQWEVSCHSKTRFAADKRQATSGNTHYPQTTPSSSRVCTFIDHAALLDLVPLLLGIGCDSGESLCSNFPFDVSYGHGIDRIHNGSQGFGLGRAFQDDSSFY